MNKSILFITIAVIIVGLTSGFLSFVYFEPTVPYYEDTNNISQVTQHNSTASNSTVVNFSESSSKITLAQLAMHNTQPDCWVGYKGKAYDLTSWLPQHPGGVNAIARYCGTSEEFQSAFQKQHGSSKASLFMKVSIYKGDLE